MPRVCTVCDHDKRLEIEHCIASNVGIRTIAKRYRLSAGSVQRHRARHVELAITVKNGKLVRKDEHDEALELRSAKVLEALESTHDKHEALCKMWFERATTEDPFREDAVATQASATRMFLEVAKSHRETMELTARLTGQMPGPGGAQVTQNTVVNNAIVVDYRNAWQEKVRMLAATEQDHRTED